MKQESNDYLGDTEASCSDDDLISRVKSPKKRRPKALPQKTNEAIIINDKVINQPAQPSVQDDDGVYRPHYKIVDSQVTDVEVKNFTPSNFKVMAGPAYNEFYQNYLKGKRSSSSSQESVILQRKPEDTSSNQTQNEKPYAEFESTSFSVEKQVENPEKSKPQEITDQEALTLADLQNAIGDNNESVSEEDEPSVIENKPGK